MVSTVLVVDDDPDLLDILDVLFRQQGYRVRRAADGLAALALVDGDRPDVVVTDIRMPILDGLGLAQQLRARPDPIPVVLLSAAQSNPHLPGVPFLAKPFDPRTLAAAVARLLSSSGHPDTGSDPPKGTG